MNKRRKTLTEPFVNQILLMCLDYGFENDLRAMCVALETTEDKFANFVNGLHKPSLNLLHRALEYSKHEIVLIPKDILDGLVKDGVYSHPEVDTVVGIALERTLWEEVEDGFLSKLNLGGVN